jgi:aspartate/methionine/tyrosine aminotransferase
MESPTVAAPPHRPRCNGADMSGRGPPEEGSHRFGISSLVKTFSSIWSRTPKRFGSVTIAHLWTTRKLCTWPNNRLSGQLAAMSALSKFSRVIFPSVRVSYTVIPPDLIERFMAVRFSLGIFPSYLFQEVLTDFIRAGRFALHIRRMRALYKERRTALVESVQNTCRDMLEIHGAGAGMHLTVALPSGFNDAEIASQAAKYGLCLWPLSPCYMNKPRHGFVLGFAATPADQMAGAVHQLWRLLKKQPGKSGLGG